ESSDRDLDRMRGHSGLALAIFGLNMTYGMYYLTEPPVGTVNLTAPQTVTFTQLRRCGFPIADYMWNARRSLCIAICKVNCLLLEGLTKIILPVRSNRSKTGVLYIPADVVKDSSFPFSADQEVVIKIDGGRLVIERRRS
ncbi:MAG TPA: hypothetical protein VEH56_02770, partial [Candidatus Saccharimonadales bacterium]|nr:hypothetical protein [Candidatus Saccharimonadales bacterium]